MTTNLRKALKSKLACHSFKGHDFCCCGDTRYVKKVTRRAARRLDKALTLDIEG
jgi:hypothetical protein